VKISARKEGRKEEGRKEGRKERGMSLFLF